MADWKKALQVMADKKRPKEDFPLMGYEVYTPSTNPSFPAELPHSDDIITFYELCDGGMLGDLIWFQLYELPQKNSFWQMSLKDIYPNNLPPIFAEIHLVVAENTQEFPLIWDKSTNQLDLFDMNKLEWVRTRKHFDEFMCELFDAEVQSVLDDSWGTALIQLERML
ncbi:hypothetical protein [Microscilla marina]|uniref:Knr4/Smi1-like domain-containing protein n=1 Tax=Microscilla marina ATCC 23134 TaxID=313606 RepID=A1ZXB4_MICM2|nr:hypothetical protein [Microscilla marina]EAY24988.1 hypothetical protein M23134_03702 [Microscilla marina ATCC 23134]